MPLQPEHLIYLEKNKTSRLTIKATALLFQFWTDKHAQAFTLSIKTSQWGLSSSKLFFWVISLLEVFTSLYFLLMVEQRPEAVGGSRLTCSVLAEVQRTEVIQRRFQHKIQNYLRTCYNKHSNVLMSIEIRACEYFRTLRVITTVFSEGYRNRLKQMAVHRLHI